jgi:uncharacterized protein (TIGR00251 family)
MTAKRESDRGAVAVDATGAVLVAVRVITRARHTRIDGLRSDAVLVRLAAPPVDGAANHALLDLLAHRLDCPRRHVQLVSGETSRDKRVRVEGLSPDEVASRLLSERS